MLRPGDLRDLEFQQGLGYSILSIVRALLRPWGTLRSVDPVGRNASLNIATDLDNRLLHVENLLNIYELWRPRTDQSDSLILNSYVLIGVPATCTSAIA